MADKILVAFAGYLRHVSRTGGSVAHGETASVDLELIESFVDVLSGWIRDLSGSRQNPNVLGVENSAQQTVGARVHNRVVVIVSVDDCGQSSLEWNTKTVSI